MPPNLFQDVLVWVIGRRILEPLTENSCRLRETQGNELASLRPPKDRTLAAASTFLNTQKTYFAGGIINLRETEW